MSGNAPPARKVRTCSLALFSSDSSMLNLPAPAGYRSDAGVGSPMAPLTARRAQGSFLMQACL